MSITLIIVIITVIISIAAFSNEKIMNDLIFYPPAVSSQRQWYRFFSHGLIHGDYAHLIFNMLSLYFFGEGVERAFIVIFAEKGKVLYLLMYVAAIAVAILPTYGKNRNNYSYRSLGASGAVSAVIFAGLLLAPQSSVYLFFIPIGIPGFIFAPLFLIFSYYLDRRGGGNINHSAHIFGALFGIIFVLVLGKLIADFNAIEWFIQGVTAYIDEHWR